MKKYFLTILVVIVGLFLTGAVSAADKDTIKAKDYEIVRKDKGKKIVSTYEELAYVFRSKPNEALLPKAQEFCDTAPFEPDAGVDAVDLYSINTKGTDGSVVNWEVKKIGESLSCTSSENPELRNGEYLLYVQLTLGLKHPTTMVVSGLCQITVSDTPEPGIYPANCWGNVISAPAEYVGGLLTTNSLLDYPTGTVTELGYNATSISMLRIFKERDAFGLIEDDND